MTIDEAKVLLCQMYLPHFDEQEKQALTMAIEALEKVQQYEEIGTVEGYEKAIQATTEYYLLMKEYKSKVQDFEAIGTIEEFKALKEKSVAKKVISRNSIYRCPTCESLVSVTQTKCTKCSQKLDWQ